MSQLDEAPALDNHFSERRIHPLWHQLRAFGNSTAAKLTILIPLVGYLILLNDRVVEFLALSERIFGQAATAGSTAKLLAIYIGLVCVALASSIYALCCPLEVKKYASTEEYIAGEEPFMSERGEGMLEARLRHGDEIARTSLRDYQQWNNSRPSVDSDEEIRRRGQRFFRIEMQLFYEMQDRSNPIARWVTAILYLIGFAALLFPSISVFVRVIQVLIKDLGLVL
ncbi:MAG TPA: hypothetical protein VL048_03845 [Xanthobacteraceae bacterium]|nr:hypothetical protein [Xanthobacteraceae bacterium]